MQITFKNKKGEVINDSNWEASWKPKKETQWKDGRSSKEFAKCASNEYFFAKQITQVLTSCGITEQDFTCTPEYKSSLGKGFGKGGCRNHDLLMEGDEDCIIGVEAKVSESFDKDWINALNEQKEKTNEEDTRAYRLRKRLVKFDSEEVDKIGYQLFTATRATINYAIEKKKNNNERFPDLHRCRRIKWIPYIINNNHDSDIVCWIKPHRRKTGKKSVCEDRVYLWAKNANFVVILGKQNKPTGYQLITSYCTNDPVTINKFEKQSKEYPDPRK